MAHPYRQWLPDAPVMDDDDDDDEDDEEEDDDEDENFLGSSPHQPAAPILSSALSSSAAAAASSSYPLPVCLKFCPGGVTYPSLSSNDRNSVAEAAVAAPLPIHWYRLGTESGVSSASSRENATLMSQLIQEAKTADDRLRKYALLYHHQQQPSSTSKTPPYVMPSLSVLAEAVFGRLTGVPADSVKEWADAMVLAHFPPEEDEDHNNNGGSVTMDVDAAESIPESEDDIWNTKPKALPPLTPTAPPPAIGLGPHPNAPQQQQPSLAYRLKTRLSLATARLGPAASRRRKRPCGYVFMRGDIAWNCRTCQTDATCVICDDCFRHSDHEGHEVYFHRTSPGGCCDCGDVEAWKASGCCDDHRPEESMAENENDSGDGTPDPMEAVRMAQKGRELQHETLQQQPTALPPATTAALATVIGAAVGCLVQAVHGAGVGADPSQFKAAYCTEVTSPLATGHAYAEEGQSRNSNVGPPSVAVQQQPPQEQAPWVPTPPPPPSAVASTVSSFWKDPSQRLPRGYQLHLRLHNDDVHTFDEVIDALHEPSRASFRRHHLQQQDGENGNTTNNNNPSLVPHRERATEMTHHVDADGQVTVKQYDTPSQALAGFHRLKTRGLHCALVTTAQVHLEWRAKQLSVWLADVCAAHPVAAALTVHALVQQQLWDAAPLAGYPVWQQARMIPCWSVMDEEDEMLACRRRFQAFPPHWDASYCTRAQARELHRLATEHYGVAALQQVLGSSNPAAAVRLQDFYKVATSNVAAASSPPPLLFPKSPHALWGTLPALYNDSTPIAEKHFLLKRLSLLGMPDPNGWMQRPYPKQNLLTQAVYVVDTDLRKQQEADRITSSVYAHKLPGLHSFLVPGDGGVKSPMQLRHLLAISSYRAPLSSILLLLLLDPYPTKQLRGATHALFLSLLTDLRFKCRFAGAFGVAYRPLSTLFCAGVGTEADTPLHFSVQILTAGSLVRALGHGPATEGLLLSDDEDARDDPAVVQSSSPGANKNTLGVFCLPIAHTITRCIHTNLLGATKEVNMILNNTYNSGAEENDDDEMAPQQPDQNDALLPALTYVAGEHPLVTLLPAAPDDGFLDSRSTRHKRLPHLLRDLEYVIETPGTALRLLLGTPVQPSPNRAPVLVFATLFARMLRLAQGMDPQKRKISGGHVEYEQNRWLEAFGLSLNIASSRDALAESPAKLLATDNVSAVAATNPLVAFSSFRRAMGHLFAAVLREIKLWLYREGLLETGLLPPLSNSGSGSGSGMGGLDLAQAEALQRSTLHVTGVTTSAAASAAGALAEPTTNMVALSCATGVKMTEHQLGLMEASLLQQGGHAPGAAPSHSNNNWLVMGDWLRVPHSPLAGDSLSFHLPLHRALAKSVRSLCSVVVLDVVRQAQPNTWWKIPVLDYQLQDEDMEGDRQPNQHPESPTAANARMEEAQSPFQDESGGGGDPMELTSTGTAADFARSTAASTSSTTHPLVPLLKPTLRSSNCRVVWMLPDCVPAEAQRRRSRARNVSAHICVTKVVHSLADHPVRCLAAAQQIERHLWARNGSSVAGMAMNYTSTPLCRAFRDLDLLLVQLSASGLAIGLGARRVFSLLLSRFNMEGHLCDPERRSQSAAGSGSSPNSQSSAASGLHPRLHQQHSNAILWVTPPRLQDPDHAVVLQESFFSTLCVICTELPPPPPRSPTDNSALRQSIRRELLHALASEPRSRSECMTAAALGVTRREESEGGGSHGGASGGADGSTGGGLFRSTFASVLENIGQQQARREHKAGGAAPPPAFELKAAVCDEYDPTFFHLRRQEHQHAMDVIARLRKQRNKTDCLPLVCPPPAAHPRFLACRLLLHLPALDAAIRRSLLFALTGGVSWLPPPEPVEVVPDTPPTEKDSGKDSFMEDVVVDDDVDDVDPDDLDMSSGDSGVLFHDSPTAASPAGAGGTDAGGTPVPTTTAFARRTLRSASGSSTFLKHRQSSDDSLGGLPPFSKKTVANSAVSFLEVLQLLTLQAHTLEECAALHRNVAGLDEESRLASSSLSINTYLQRLVWVPDSLVNVWALKPHTQGGPLDSKGSGERRGSVLGLLIALYEHRADHGGKKSGGDGRGGKDDSDAGEHNGGDGGGDHHSDHHGGARSLAANGLKWLLRFVSALVDGASRVGAAAKSATTGVPVLKSPAADGGGEPAAWTIDNAVRQTIRGMLQNLPDLWPSAVAKTEDDPAAAAASAAAKEKSLAGKAAQRRVMEMMMQKQKTFAATLGGDASDAQKKGPQAAEEEEEECIICRCDDADGENNGPLGYLGHVQRSRMAQMRQGLEGTSDVLSTFRVVGHMGCQLRETQALDSKALACLPRGSVVTVLQKAYSPDYGILSRRVLVRHTSPDSGVVSQGWASVMSSQGYVILSPLSLLCFHHSKWGATRPIIKQCGHAAHLKCVETHTLSLHQRAAGEQPYDGRFAANISDGEFLCPLCKQLSNILIPRGRRHSKPEQCMEVDGGRATQRERRDVELLFCIPQLASLPEASKTVAAAESIAAPANTNEGADISGTANSNVNAVASTTEEPKEDLHLKALQDFGSHLYQAMEVSSWGSSSSDRTPSHYRKKQQRWHPAIRKWDYEEEEEGDARMGSELPRLFRQQLIAWAAVGHSAAAAEAGARGLEEDGGPFGLISQTSDPWGPDFSKKATKHPLLQELGRTLSGSAGLLEALCTTMTKQLSSPSAKEDAKSTPVVLKCLGDLLAGESWVVSASSLSGTQANAAIPLSLWTEVTALTTCLPCHVARDGVLSVRSEARAAAAALWATQGLGSTTTTSSSAATNHPALPLSVQKVLQQEQQQTEETDVAASQLSLAIPQGWGTKEPVASGRDQDELLRPFRLGVACGYLYTPLLAWDLNTFTGAIFSALLLHSVDELPTASEWLLVARSLISARMIQAMVLPNGLPNLDEEELDVDYELWGDPREQKAETQGQAVWKLLSHVRGMALHRKLDPATGWCEADSGTLPSPAVVLAGVGQAILPYCRSLLLLLRATVAVTKERQKAASATSTAAIEEGDDQLLESVLTDGELMEREDGFFFIQALEGPLPGDLVSAEERDLTQINKWLVSLIGFEAHQGSSGKSLLPLITEKFGTPLLQTQESATEQAMADSESKPPTESVEPPPEGMPQQQGSNADDQVMADAPAPAAGGFVVVRPVGAPDDETTEGADEAVDEVDMVDAAGGEDEDDEEMVDFADAIGGGAGGTGGSAASGDDPSLNDLMSSDENSESGSEEGGGPDHSSAFQFANVSRSPIIPYQSSFLGQETIGPGRHGANFEFGTASAVMSDLSHLSLIHRKEVPTFHLIRLPKSFVELYNIVSKVKGREGEGSGGAGGGDEHHHHSHSHSHEDVGNTETAICLLTGTVMRSGSPRRSGSSGYNRALRPPGACTLHARKHGSGIGLYFLVQKCTVLLMHNNKSAYSPSLYVDEHGEEDPGLRRGRPLFLNHDRYRALESLWRQQGIPREVAQIRSTSDRVIRDNWY